MEFKKYEIQLFRTSDLGLLSKVIAISGQLPTLLVLVLMSGFIPW